MSTNDRWSPESGQDRVDRIWADLNQGRQRPENRAGEQASRA